MQDDLGQRRSRFFLWVGHGALIVAPVLAVLAFPSAILDSPGLRSSFAVLFAPLLIWLFGAATYLIVVTLRSDRPTGFLYLSVVFLSLAYSALILSSSTESVRLDSAWFFTPAVTFFVEGLVALAFARAALPPLLSSVPFPLAVIVAIHVSNAGGCVPIYTGRFELPWVLLGFVGLTLVVGSRLGRTWHIERVGIAEKVMAVAALVLSGGLALLFLVSSGSDIGGSCEGSYVLRGVHHIIGPFWI